MKKILITAGGTNEKIDSVRAISNQSTGQLGSIIADYFADDFDVFYLHGQGAKMPSKTVKSFQVEDTASLSKVLLNLFEIHQFDFIIHAMAISDYHVNVITSKSQVISNILNLLKVEPNPSYDDIDQVFFKNYYSPNQKIDSSIDDLLISLHQNIKFIDFIKEYQPQSQLISFKLENNISKDELFNIAKKQLNRTDSFLVVANLIEDINDQQHIAYILDKNDQVEKVFSKDEIAEYLYEIVRENA